MVFQKELIKSLLVNSERTAIEKGDQKLSYGQVFAKANKVTAFLSQKSLAKETVIGVNLPERDSFICAVIGVLNSRCMFVSIDESLPRERLKGIISNIGLNYLITSRNSATIDSVESDQYIQKYYIEDIEEDVNDSEVKFMEYPDFEMDDSIYLYFTSGTTGIPKGIVGRNKSLLQFINWEIKTFEIISDVRVSQFINPNFDAFLRDVFVPLLSGGTICIPPNDADFYSPEKIVSWIDKQNINLIHCVPSVFRNINSEFLSAKYFTNLKYILLSGERIIPAELDKWYAIFHSRIQLVNLYGATETTMIRAFYKIKPEDVRGVRIPIGNPIDDTELLILDKNFKACNALIPGDLYIVSPFLSKGYFNDLELTKQKFIKINTGKQNGAIAFKTGDTARLLANGQIDLIGREDRQVKIRGIRVEIDEIENRLLQSGFIKNAVVVKYEDKGIDTLAAFIVRSEELNSLCNVRQDAENYLKDYLHDYMIPSNIVEVSEFPLLPTGKINSHALLENLVQEEIVEPENQTEEKLLLIWKDILGDRLISTSDSFNKIGGNSLNIMRLIGLLYSKFNVRVTLSDLFKNLTIKKQSELINSLRKDSLFSVVSAGKKASYNLSSAQERMYYEYELNRKSTAYNMPLAWEIKGTVDIKRINNAVKLLIERHENLRTAFLIVDHRAQQVVKDAGVFEIEEFFNLNLADELEKFVRPFDLSKAPLLRVGVIHAESSTILVIDMPHIICDGMSQTILGRDFLALYQGKELAMLPFQYKDYAEWEWNFRKTTEYIFNREFWLKSFEGMIPKLDLPITQSTLTKTEQHGGSVNFHIDSEAMKGILSVLTKYEVTNASVLFSIYLLFLYHISGQEDIVVGTNTSGRMLSEFDGVAGMFTKTLPIRFHVNVSDSFTTFAKKVNEYLIQAYSHQLYDLADIVTELNKKNSAPISSLFSAMFVSQNFYETDIASDDFSEYYFEKSVSKYPITLMSGEADNGFYFRMEYSSSQFAKADIDFLIEQFKTLVTLVAGNSEVAMREYICSDTHSGIAEDDIVFNF